MITAETTTDQLAAALDKHGLSYKRTGGKGESEIVCQLPNGNQLELFLEKPGWIPRRDERGWAYRLTTPGWEKCKSGPLTSHEQQFEQLKDLAL